MVWFFQAVSGVVQSLFKIWRQCTKQVKSCYKDDYHVVKWTNGYKPHKSLSDFLEPQLSEQNEQDAEDTPFKPLLLPRDDMVMYFSFDSTLRLPSFSFV